MTRKKKKKNTIDFEADAGQGFENFNDPPTRINVFDRARKIKSWNMFVHLAEQENITPAEALTLVLKHVKKHWKEFKILKDPNQLEAIADLLKWETELTRGKLYDSQYLKDFSAITGYKIPKAYHTFENEMGDLRDVFGAKRDHSGKYTKKQLEAAAAKALKKGYKGKR